MPTDLIAEPAAITAIAIEYPKFRWAVLATTCFCVLGFQVSVMSYSPILGDISKTLGVSLAQGVNLMTFFMLFAAISFFAAGPFCDKLGAPASTIVAAAFSAVPTLATFWIGYSYGAVAFIRILQGCAVGFTLVALAPLVLQWFPPHQRGIALGIPGACNPLGAILGVLLAPVLFKSNGDWRLTVTILSAFGWFALVYAIVVFTLAKKCTPKSSSFADNVTVSRIFRAALRSPFTWFGVLATFCVNWMMQSAFSLSPSYFAEPQPVGLGLGPLTAGQLMGIVQIGAVLGPILGGIALDKIFGGRARGVLTIAFAISLTYAALQFAPIYTNRPVFIVFLLLSGAGIGMQFPLIQSLVGASYDHHIVGRMNGVWLGLGAFGGSAGLFVNSIALKNSGSYILPINIITASAVVGLILCAFLRPESLHTQK